MSASAGPESEKAAAPVADRGGEEEKAEAGSGGEILSLVVADTRPVATDCNKHSNYKNRLQEWTQRNNLNLPVYHTESKGDPHQLEFSSTVKVGDKPFPSDQCHSRLKDAEQDAAKVAYESLVTLDHDPTNVLELIDQPARMSASASPESEKAAAPVADIGGKEEKAEAKEAGSGGEILSLVVADTRPVATDCYKHTNYKNRLQEWTQRNKLNLPVYHTELKGDPHQLEFSSTVKVGDKPFPSDQCHSRLKDAEQDAAKVAYESLVPLDDDPTDVLELIDQGVVFCKSILNEFAVKTKVTQPTYTLDCPEGLAPITVFVSSVVFAGNTYTGESATNKKVAEQKAAHLAVKSILATNNTCMKEIIRSKKQLIDAITSSGFSKKRVVSQENCNAPTNAITTFAPIKFVPAVGAVCPTADQRADIIPSGQAISSSKKRKKHITTGQNVSHRHTRAALWK